MAIASLCVLLPEVAKPQVDTGTIRGTITDSSGRPVPDAQVSITNQGTGFVSNAKSSSDGTYLFTPLHAGTYSVTVAMTGFDKETKAGITLDVQQNAVVDFGLKPGQVSTSVDVTATTPLLQS
jgi:hypothetical protein